MTLCSISFSFSPPGNYYVYVYIQTDPHTHTYYYNELPSAFVILHKWEQISVLKMEKSAERYDDLILTFVQNNKRVRLFIVAFL